MRPLILLSPAKTLNFEAALSPALAKAAATAPHYLSEAHALAASLGTLSQAELGKLMSLSASLASLNHARYADFTAQPTRIAAAAFGAAGLARLYSGGAGSAAFSAAGKPALPSSRT